MKQLVNQLQHIQVAQYDFNGVHTNAGVPQDYESHLSVTQLIQPLLMPDTSWIPNMGLTHSLTFTPRRLKNRAVVFFVGVDRGQMVPGSSFFYPEKLCPAIKN